MKLCALRRDGAIIRWYDRAVHSADGSFSGQCEVEARTFRSVMGCPQAAAMRFDNSAADPESQADALRFGREEGIEYLVCLLLSSPIPVSLTEIVRSWSSALCDPMVIARG